MSNIQDVFRFLHHLLVKNPQIRGSQRRFTRTLKSAMGCPDAYGDLLKIAQRAQPSAVLDIGCYDGDAIDRFLDDLPIPIYGFEPTPASFKKLNDKYGGNDQVHLFNCALTDIEGSSGFFQNANPQTNSLLDNASSNQDFFLREIEHVNRIDIQVTTLDAWCARYLPLGNLLIKADIQGAKDQ